MNELFAWLFAYEALSKLHRVLLLTHITTALGALALGPITMLARKGGPQHRLEPPQPLGRALTVPRDLLDA